MFIRSQDGWSWFLQSAIFGYMQSVLTRCAFIKKFYNDFLQCIDVAKTPMAPAKGTVKAKADKGKTDSTAQYDYQDGSVHDGAVRARLLRGYERFKVSILPQ
jgi:hypothetical protein